MNFPMQFPLYQFFHWLVNTPGVGSAVAALAGIGSITTYALTLRHIRAAKDEAGETYWYPTPALHQSDDH
ncbi:MAG: hypothetical protein Fur0043_19700 [Anaerolineales bacterium]